MYKKTVVLLHEFDDNVAVIATTIVSTTTGIIQFQAKMPAEVPASSWRFGLPTGRACPRRQWE